MLTEYEQAKQEFSRGMDIILANCYVISGGKYCEWYLRDLKFTYELYHKGEEFWDELWDKYYKVS